MATLKTSYDYIIVGAGVGGLVLASRLSEDSSINVLVVEAGANHMGDPRIETPGFLGALYGNPDFDWDYMSEPQIHVNNRQIGQPRGRMVGGSSAMNFSVIMYPSYANLESWESLGNEGWGAEEMAPYLRKFHTYTPPSEATSELLSTDRYMKSSEQGTKGPVPVTLPDIYGPFNKAWDETFAHLGWFTDADPIDGRKIGTFTSPLSVDANTGRRGYAGAYYTTEVAQRPNLHLLPETLVERVLTTQEDGEVVATGIQIRTKDGRQDELSASREVILCAGSLNSPQLLELSGIGATELLQKHNIPIVLDRPGVGENLQDHCLSTVSFEVADGQISGDIMRDPVVLQSIIQLYEQTHGGPLTGMPVSMACLPMVDHDGKLSRDQVESLLAEHLDNSQSSTLSPALQRQYALQRKMLVSGQEASSQYMFLPTQLQMSPGANTMSDVLAKTLPGNYISVMVLHNNPFSRGSVHIRSGKPGDKPAYDPNYLSHPLDLEILARHTQFVDQIAATEPFASLLKQGSRVPADIADLSSLEQAKQVVKDRLFHCFHPAGTCAMMPVELGGVVDSKLRVHGARNLRVVDASVFPLVPTGNIQATVYALAERAADLIRAG